MSNIFLDNLEEYMTQPTIIEVAASVHAKVETPVIDYTHKSSAQVGVDKHSTSDKSSDYSQ